MWNNRLKAITFSFDDGVIQDKRLISLLKKYHVKATFNLNSLRGGHVWYIDTPMGKFKHEVIPLSEWVALYEGFEVAGHTLDHPDLIPLSDEEVIREIKEDNQNLEKLFGYKINGFVYPGGPPNNDARIINLIKDNTDIKYARTYETSHSFDLEKNLLCLKATAQWLDKDLDAMVDDFLSLKPNKPQILFIWGHSYEADIYNLWDKFENILKKISNRDDIFYGTNSEVFLAQEEFNI